MVLNGMSFDHPIYGPDLVLSEYHLFSQIKIWFKKQHFDNDEELQAGMVKLLKSQAAKFYNVGIIKMVSH